MARLMDADDGEVFRATISVVRVGERWRNGLSERTYVAGPYRERAGALQAVSRAERENTAWGDESVTVTGTVERSALVWEPVP